jgi:sugar phosphate isomerase/epimerase
MAPHRTRFAWRISPQTYAWRIREQPAAEDLPAFVRAGVDDAYHAGYGGIELALSVLHEPARVEALGALLAGYHLELAAVFATVPTTSDGSTIKKVASHAAAIGCPVLNVAITTPARVDPAHARLDVTVRILEQLASALPSPSIRTCWHPHAEDFRRGSERVRRVLEATRGCDTSICLDLGWVLRAGEPAADTIDLCGERLGFLHVRDVADGHWCQAVGDGQLPVTSMLSALDRIQYSGWLAVELWFDRETRVTRTLFENARMSLAAMRRDQATD